MCRRGYPVRVGAVESIPPAMPVLGIDPGQHMGLAVVHGRTVLWTCHIDWREATAHHLTAEVSRAVRSGVTLAVIEVLGQARGGARTWASSWASMSRTTGRAIQECERQGLTVEEVDPGTWRERIGQPRSWGGGKTKDDTARQVAAQLLGLTGVSAHECEAALIATGVSC